MGTGSSKSNENAVKSLQVPGQIVVPTPNEKSLQVHAQDSTLSNQHGSQVHAHVEGQPGQIGGRRNRKSKRVRLIKKTRKFRKRKSIRSIRR